jgi:hypothetical protein
MNKIMAAMVVLTVAAAWVPEASALPSFARQTGMACSACHQQHFPVLNKFGREFKASGYTLMGDQGKVEGDNLSIPTTLNGSILVKVRYQKDNTPATDNVSAGTANTLGDGQLQFGDELGLYFGGRVADNVGFLFEANTVATTGSLMSGLKIPVTFEVPKARVSIVPFTTDNLGVQYGYELSSGGVLGSNRWAEHRRETSAVQYNADLNAVPGSMANVGAATGFAFVAQNDFGYVNFTKWSPNYAMGGDGSSLNSFDMGSRYFRIAATPTVKDWDMVVGFGVMGGESLVSDAGTPISGGVASFWETRQTFADFQAHGLVGKNDLGVYAQFAKAPVASSPAAGSLYGAGLTDRKAVTLGADYSVIPNVLSVGAAYRNASNGADAAVNGDNALTFTAVYDFAMNVSLHANYSKYKGSSREAVGDQTSLYTLQLEAGW